jgi:uncharacterized protein YndB with AHSA1/START domain
MTPARPDFDPGPLAQVDCVVSDDGPTLVFVRDLRHPPEKVWAALTDPAQLREWSPYTADRALTSTGPATLRMIDGNQVEEFAASVIRVEPPTLLEYTWGASRLRWELAASPTGTRLTLRHTVEREDWVPKVAAGWHLCLTVADHLLAGRPVGPIVGDNARNYGWEQLHDAYADALGIAATGGPDADQRLAAQNRSVTREART